MDKGSVIFGKMAERKINFEQKLPYLKNSVNPDKVAKYFDSLTRNKSVPAFKKQSAILGKDDGLPSFLKVFYIFIFFIIGIE